MDLNRVAVAIEVVERRSFTAAARSLGVPKSSVSRSVSQLEAELGVALLRRTTRRLALTEAGEAWYERARRALGELEEANALVARGERAPRGRVRLTAPPDYAASLGRALVEFGARHPGVSVEVVLTAQRLDLVADGIDLALRAGRLEDSSLVVRKLSTADFGLFAAPAYLAERGRPRAPDELASHACVLFRASHGRAVWRLEGPRGQVRAEVTGRLASDNMDFTLEAVAAGAGIGLLPQARSLALLGERRIERVLPAWHVAGGALSIVYPATRFLPRRAELLRDFLVERFGTSGGGARRARS